MFKLGDGGQLEKKSAKGPKNARASPDHVTYRPE